MLIPLHKPSIKRGDMDAVLTCMVNDSLSPGELCARLTAGVASYLGLEGGVAVREYHRAVEMALEALGLARGARVILSPLCPPVYAQVCAERGFEMILSDVEADTGCIAVQSIERLSGETADALICHYPLGFVPDMEELTAFGIPVIEDISQAIGANTGERRAGCFGDYTILSLEAENIVTAGGGCLVLGRGRKEATRLRDRVADFGSPRLLPDMNAALGLTQIKEIERFIARRKDIAQIYTRALLQSKHKTLVQRGEAENVYFSFPVLIEKGLKDVQSFARKKGVETRPAFADSILARLSGQESQWPAAYALYLRCLLFPLFPSLGKTNTDVVQKVLAVLP